jgi:hypothetical protein
VHRPTLLERLLEKDIRWVYMHSMRFCICRCLVCVSLDFTFEKH